MVAVLTIFVTVCCRRRSL